jgi:hypothetical protein
MKIEQKLPLETRSAPSPCSPEQPRTPVTAAPCRISASTDNRPWRIARAFIPGTLFDTERDERAA